MRKSRFTESQIVAVLKQVEGGRTVKEVCRKHGISDATYYNWKSKYGGMEVSDLRKRMKETEQELHQLKRMYADRLLLGLYRFKQVEKLTSNLLPRESSTPLPTCI